MRGRPDPISQNEREFIAAALNEGLRIDGRALYDFRELSITFRGYGHAEAAIGATRCMCSVSAEIVEPPPERPNAGVLQLFCELSPMASPEFRVGRSSDRAVEIGQILERGLKQSKAVDTEALCILAGRKVWCIRLDVHVLDNQGNMVDCCNLAAVAALRHFRKPEVVVTGEEVRVFSIEERQPAPLSILHSPVSVSIGFIQTGEEEDNVLLVVDPLLREEETSCGTITITQNSNRELCAMQKLGGVAVPMSTIIQCNDIAAVKVAEISAFLQRVLDEDEEHRAKVPRGTSKREFEAVDVDGSAGHVPMAVDVEPLKHTTHVSPAPPALQQQPIEAAKPETAPEEQQQLNPLGASAENPQTDKKPKKKLKVPNSSEPGVGGNSPGLDLSSALNKKKKKKTKPQ